MRCWAAIDLLGGRVVTLTKGYPASPTVWSTDAGKVAARWEESGADGLHVVDLDKALGSGANEREIRSVLGRANIPVEVGGGIRTLEGALRWLEMGASRIVIGTMAYADPGETERLVRAAGSGRVSAAVDFRRGHLLTDGWRKEWQLDAAKAMEAMGRLGVGAIITTDAGADGTASGPDLLTLRKLRHATNLELVASGGIRSPEDVAELESLGMDGVILGRALYEGTIALRESRRK